jgi:hypothetical protein
MCVHPSRRGVAFLQLTAVKVKDLPTISFVYGSLRLVRPDLTQRYSAVIETSQPIQGLLLQSAQKLFMFSTPISSQRLYLQVRLPPQGRLASASATISNASVMNNGNGSASLGNRFSGKIHTTINPIQSPYHMICDIRTYTSQHRIWVVVTVQ